MTQSTMSVLDEHLALVSVHVGSFAGYRRATREHIAAMGGSLPQSAAVTEGSIKVFPCEPLRPFATIRRQIARTIEAKGVRALGSGAVFAVPRTALPEIETALDQAAQDFEKEKAALDANYETLFEAHVLANPEAAAIIRTLKVERAAAIGKLHFGSSVFQIVPVLREGEDPAKGVADIVAGLARQLFEEVAAEMGQLAKSDGFAVKGRVGQKALRPIRTAVAKMRGLAFLDPCINGAIAFIGEVLSGLPQQGYIEDAGGLRPFSTLRRLVDILADADELANAAGRASNAVPAAEILFPPVVPPAPAEAVQTEAEADPKAEVAVSPPSPSAAEPAPEPGLETVEAPSPAMTVPPPRGNLPPLPSAMGIPAPGSGGHAWLRF